MERQRVDRYASGRAWLRWLGPARFVALSALLNGPSALGQQAYFSLGGSFLTGGDEHDIYLNLERPVGSDEQLRFESFSHSGGVNAAGDTILANGVDEVLVLHDPTLTTEYGFSDDDNYPGGNFDAMLSWPGVAVDPRDYDAPLSPSPLPAGPYDLVVYEYDSLMGDWTVDMVGPADALTFTGASPFGTGRVTSLKFGATGVGDAPARATIEQSMVVYGPLVAGQPGQGAPSELTVPDGESFTTQGRATIYDNATLRIAGGTYKPLSALDIAGGTLHKVITGYGDPTIASTGGLVIRPGSTLKLEVADGFVPVANDVFPIINSSFNNVTAFSKVEGLIIGGGLMFEVLVQPKAMSVRVVRTLDGDTDYDGDVDDFDLLNAISNFTGSLNPGTGGKLWADGDTDADGDADDFDLLAMISSFTGSLPPSSTSVPEPGALGLLAIGLGGVLVRRRACRHP